MRMMLEVPRGVMDIQINKVADMMVQMEVDKLAKMVT